MNSDAFICPNPLVVAKKAAGEMNEHAVFDMHQVVRMVGQP